MSERTLYDKLWDTHCVGTRDDGSSLVYIDRHLVHEVTSPQAFAGLRLAGRTPWRREGAVATPDHNVPTEAGERSGGVEGIRDQVSRVQVQVLSENCRDFDITLLPINDTRQGIVHVVGPELGVTLPGMTVVCGDSHTSTHGALGALAFGIGTSEVEHVFATQCLVQHKMQNMRVRIHGRCPPGISAKDLALALIAQIGTAGGAGCAMEFAGEAVEALSMEGRMTLCNMAVEAGARSGMVAVDERTLEYVRARPHAPKGEMLRAAERAWAELHSDAGAAFERETELDASALEPQVSWGTQPDMVTPVGERIPDPAQETDVGRRRSMERALEYMDLQPGTPVMEIPLDRVFIGSCTNARLEDLRMAAEVLRGKKVAARIRQALVVPGSGQVKAAAEEEGLDRVFVDAGMEWREPGCSMCLGMNPDRLQPGEHCASTSNRNFEGRQGHGGRTHLVSPAMAAAAAVAGHFVDVRQWLGGGA